MNPAPISLESILQDEAARPPRKKVRGPFVLDAQDLREGKTGASRIG